MSLALVAMVCAGCGETRFDQQPVTAPRYGQGAAEVTLRCVGTQLQMSSTEVLAGADGVHLVVSGSGPEAPTLNLEWPGGGSGDVVPARPQKRVVQAPPGELSVSCGINLNQEMSPKRLLHVDGAFASYSSKTPKDFGCPSWGTIQADWIGNEGVARDPALAVRELLKTFPDAWDETARLEVGYPNNPEQTWLLTKDGKSIGTALVRQEGSTWLAHRDSPCHPFVG